MRLNSALKAPNRPLKARVLSRFLDNNMLVVAVDIALMKDNFAQATLSRLYLASVKALLRLF